MEIHFIHKMFDQNLDQDESDVEETDLELSGLDPEELEFMYADERWELLEDAGLNPAEYDC